MGHGEFLKTARLRITREKQRFKCVSRHVHRWHLLFITVLNWDRLKLNLIHLYELFLHHNVASCTEIDICVEEMIAIGDPTHIQLDLFKEVVEENYGHDGIALEDFALLNKLLEGHSEIVSVKLKLVDARRKILDLVDGLLECPLPDDILQVLALEAVEESLTGDNDEFLILVQLDSGHIGGVCNHRCMHRLEQLSVRIHRLRERWFVADHTA